MIGSGHKLNWTWLVIVAFAGVLIFQFPALRTHLHDLDSYDIDGIRAGCEYAQTYGTAHWWYSPWINHTAPYFRPLVSYAHYAQLYMLDRFGFLPLTVFSMILYASLAVASGVLAFLVSHRREVAYLACLLVTAFHVPGDRIWLAYFPFIDNFFSMLFQVGALCYFVRFLHLRLKWMLIVTWVLFLASGLCKEQGWITPLLMLALAFFLPLEKEARRIGMTHAVLMGVASALMLQYVGKVTNTTRSISPLPENFWLHHFYAGTWWIISIGLSIALALALAIRYRAALNSPLRRAGVLLLWSIAFVICIMLAPVNDLPRGQYALVFLMDNAGIIATSGVIICVYGWVAQWAMRRFYLHRAPSTALTLCIALASLPATLSGARIDETRFVFLLPYVAALAALAVVVAYDQSHARENIHLKDASVRFHETIA